MQNIIKYIYIYNATKPKYKNKKYATKKTQNATTTAIN